jgi:glycosyltransferase involved in cell wall biosynthesis
MGSDLNTDIKDKSLPPRQLDSHQTLNNCFLVVGTLERRKGHDVLLESLAHLKIPASIIVIGRPGYDGNRIGHGIVHHLDYGKRLFLIDDCPDDLLQIAYSRCRAVICPSRAEGFGLPLIEAAIKGKKIIANDIPIFREVANDYSLQVDFYANNCPKSLANVITIISKEENNAIEPRASMLKSVPTWRDSAKSVLAILNELR